VCQVTSVLVLASGVQSLGVQSLTDAAAERSDHWGFYALPWVVIVLVPIFFLFSIALAAAEIYLEVSTTFGARKERGQLLSSLRLPSQSRKDADLLRIYELLITSEFLKAYPYAPLSQLGRTCELLELKAHGVLFREGEIGEHFFVLIHGTLDFYVKDKAPPHRLKCLNTFHDSGSFGDRAVSQVHPAFFSTRSDWRADMLVLRPLPYRPLTAMRRRLSTAMFLFLSLPGRRRCAHRLCDLPHRL
jgi:hypothetical protein